MNRILLIYCLVFMTFSAVTGQKKTLHDFTGRTIDGQVYDFSALKGKKVLIVNTATECSLTGQFKKLQELYEEYGGDNFEIVAFPSNDFGNQEPGDNEHIQSFCTLKYGISFLLMEKISLKGEDIHPIYQWLTNIEENGSLDGRVIWNFQKFMIDENGIPVDFLSPVTSPYNRRIISWLQE